MLYDTDTGYMNFLFESSVDTLYFRVFSELAIWGDSLSVNVGCIAMRYVFDSFFE